MEKQTEALGDGEWPLAERKNMVYAGTAITYGRGKGVVVATGMATEFGKTAAMLESVALQDPLQESLDKSAERWRTPHWLSSGSSSGWVCTAASRSPWNVDLRHCSRRLCRTLSVRNHLSI